MRRREVEDEEREICWRRAWRIWATRRLEYADEEYDLKWAYSCNSGSRPSNIQIFFSPTNPWCSFQNFDFDILEGSYSYEKMK